MAIYDTNGSLLSTGSGSSDGKVKVQASGSADYLKNKIYSSNDSLLVSVIDDKLSITENSSYEAVISPATNFPIMNCNATYTIKTYVAGDADKTACVNKINLPSGQIESISLFGGMNSSNNKHLYIAVYGNDVDNVQGATKFGEALDVTSTSYMFELESPIKIEHYKFYWIMGVISAESSGGDAVNGRTTSITGAGIGTWQQTAGIGYIDNPFSGSVGFEDTFDYTINYLSTYVHPYIQCQIVK